MKKLLIIVLVTISLIAGYIFLNEDNSSQKTSSITQTEDKMEKEAIVKKANFKIITNGTTRIFTDSKYHNQNEYVFIEKIDPSIVIVKKENIKWSDFFNSLPSPMKLTKECLTTGTGQGFCTNESKKLYFFLNGNETSNVIDLVIKNNDNLLIEYK